MKKPKRKKPKFYKGQVVTMAEEAEGYVFRVARVCRVASGENQYLDESAMLRYGPYFLLGILWHYEKELRPLTAKEIGPRRK